MYQGEYIELKDFSGGLVVPAIFGSSYANAGVNLALNQASDLDNIYILPTGTGFRSRPGKTIINTSSALDGPVVGLHYLLEADLDDYTFAVAGTKIYRASTSDFSSLADITGAVVITSDETNYWDLLTFDDAVIGFGGPSSAPEAPWRATNSGNAAALGGSPPSAAGAFTVNNRVFAFRTAANPSIIYWSIIGNAEDWTGTGSGNTTVGSLDDNDRITGVLPVDTNSAFIFKQNSIYRMILNEAPFPVYLVASGDAVGATGKKALINIDSTMFWLAPDCKIKFMSPGGEIGELPPNHLMRSFQNPQTAILFRQTGSDYDWLVISQGDNVLDSTTLVWDLKNKCWLKHSTGYERFTSVTTVVNSDALGTPLYYYGDANGFIWQIAASSSRDTNSAGTNVAISSYWQSGWLIYPNIDRLVQINKMDLIYSSAATFTVEYAFDFATTYTKSFTLAAGTATTFKAGTSRLQGRGNALRYKISNSALTGITVMSVLLAGKSYGQKTFGA